MTAGQRRLVMVVVVVVSLLTTPSTAGAQAADLAALTNRTRASLGLPALTVDPALSAVAGLWSTAMAAAGTISHNPALKNQVPGGWALIGENVGMGGSVEVVYDALLASPPHYANITNPAFDRLGVGYARAGASVFTTQIFWDSRAAPPAPPPPPTTAPPAPATSPPPATPPAAVTPPSTPVPTPVVRQPAPAPADEGPADPAQPDPEEVPGSSDLGSVGERVREVVDGRLRSWMAWLQGILGTWDSGVGA